MPEGPSIVILKEAVQPFKGKKIKAVSGNTKKIDLSRLQGQTVVDFKSWGKQFLVCFKDFTLRVHFMMFGSYRVNEQRESPPRLHLQFSNGELNFYACSVKFLEEDPDVLYDWSGDVMNEAWDEAGARKKLKGHPRMLVCDALLDQHIFAGVGNIIKNEVLFRIKLHPESHVGALPAGKLNALLREAVNYSFDFLKWKKEFTLRAHWLVHTKKICPRCGIPFVKKYLGRTHRRTFFCENCQELYRLYSEKKLPASAF